MEKTDTREKRPWTRLCRTVLFWGLGLVLFFCVQKLLTPKYSWPKFDENQKYTVDGFRSLEKNTEDVFFLGTSHMLFGVSPMRLYEQYGISAYNLATSVQTVEGSYFLMQQIFRTQSPKVIILDASELFFSDDTGRNLDAGVHYIMDAFPLSPEKVEFAWNYQQLYDRAKDNPQVREAAGAYAENVFWSCLLPVIKYHDRWQEMNETDFTGYQTLDNYYTAGQFLSSVVQEVTLTKESMKEQADELKERGLYRTEIPEQNLVFLRKMKELCDENRCQLVLTKVPCYAKPGSYFSAWTEDRFETTAKTAEDLGIEYIDLMYEADVPLDLGTDSVDGGKHLNAKGSLKTSDYFGQYLQENCGVGSVRNERYEENLPAYRQVFDVVELEAEGSLTAYLDKLIQNRDRYVIVIAGQNDMQAGLSEEEKEKLSGLGLKTAFDEKMYMHSYLAVIEKGNVRYEAESVDTLSKELTLDGGARLQLVSGGYLAYSRCSVILEGNEYAQNTIGMNVVVIDPGTGLVLDSVVFNTYSSAHPGKRTAAWTNRFLRAYENSLIFGFPRYDIIVEE
ncbi:MAG: hypothetical protein II930_06085 [Lachnospiraceae bacterium]|nr:hypothetical protein [Lachnospiraceae bacterium]